VQGWNDAHQPDDKPPEMSPDDFDAIMSAPEADAAQLTDADRAFLEKPKGL